MLDKSKTAYGKQKKMFFSLWILTGFYRVKTNRISVSVWVLSRLRKPGDILECEETVLTSVQPLYVTYSDKAMWWRSDQRKNVL